MSHLHPTPLPSRRLPPPPSPHTHPRANDLVLLDIKINGELAPPLSVICHRDQAYRTGRQLTSKLKELIPRQMFRVPIQVCREAGRGRVGGGCEWARVDGWVGGGWVGGGVDDFMLTLALHLTCAPSLCGGACHRPVPPPTAPTNPSPLPLPPLALPPPPRPVWEPR
jgi:hypothetical protein